MQIILIIWWLGNIFHGEIKFYNDWNFCHFNYYCFAGLLILAGSRILLFLKVHPMWWGFRTSWSSKSWTWTGGRRWEAGRKLQVVSWTRCVLGLAREKSRKTPQAQARWKRASFDVISSILSWPDHFTNSDLCDWFKCSNMVFWRWSHLI